MIHFKSAEKKIFIGLFVSINLFSCAKATSTETTTSVATQATCESYLTTSPTPAGLPAATGPAITQRANLLASKSKIVIIGGNRYYTVSIPTAFYTATKPVVILNLPGTAGYPEAEWTDWNASMTTQKYAFISLHWFGGTPSAITDSQIYSDFKQILSDVGSNCPISTAKKWVMGFSVGSAFSFAVMVNDIAGDKIFTGQLAISGSAIGPLTTGIAQMHSTVESAKSNAQAVLGVKSWMYCGHADMDHGWDMCTEMPYGRDFINNHGGSATLYESATGSHGSLPTLTAGKSSMFAYIDAN